MREWLRRIRGALGIGLTWAVAWAPLGVLWAALPFVPPPFLAAAVTFAIQYAVMGFVGGASFSAVLGLLGGRLRLDEMSLPRFAAWGAGGGIVMNVLLNTVVASALRVVGIPIPPFALANILFGAVTTLLAAGSAAGALTIARGGEDRELLGTSSEVGAVGLTQQEAQQLLS